MAHRTVDRKQASDLLRYLSTSGKTPVSVVMELATRLGMVAEFKETNELRWSNAPFKYMVKLGDLKAVGAAGSKKEAKQNSAKELIKLISNESENAIASPAGSSPRVEPRLESSFTTPTSSAYSSPPQTLLCGNSIGELQNLAARKLWPLPDYEFGEPTGVPHSKTFTCLVKMMSGLKCTGVGSSKKSAKKNAAEKMLNLLQDGQDFDDVDAGSSMSNTTSSSNTRSSSSELLNDSDLDEYRAGGWERHSSPPPPPPPAATKLDFSSDGTNDVECDELAVEKLTNLGLSHDFRWEFIPLPSKSIKGLHQVFLRLIFTSENKINQPIVMHGSGETRRMAELKAAERACEHLHLLMSVQ